MLIVKMEIIWIQKKIHFDHCYSNSPQALLNDMKTRESKEDNRKVRNLKEYYLRRNRQNNVNFKPGLKVVIIIKLKGKKGSNSRSHILLDRVKTNKECKKHDRKARKSLYLKDYYLRRKIQRNFKFKRDMKVVKINKLVVKNESHSRSTQSNNKFEKCVNSDEK